MQESQFTRILSQIDKTKENENKFRTVPPRYSKLKQLNTSITKTNRQKFVKKTRESRSITWWTLV